MPQPDIKRIKEEWLIDRYYLININKKIKANFLDDNVFFTYWFYLINLFFPGFSVYKNNQDKATKKGVKKPDRSIADVIYKIDKPSIDISRIDVKERNKSCTNIADVAKKVNKPGISIEKTDIKTEKPGITPYQKT